MGRYDRIADLADLTSRSSVRPDPTSRPADRGDLTARSADASGEPGTLQIADLASGYGRTARTLLRRAEAEGVAVRVHAVDTASTLDDDVLHDERVRFVFADPDEGLPFADASLDRVVSVNVLEHLADPVAHLAECARALLPGGLMVLVHSDWDTALFASEDDALTRRLVDRFVATPPSFAERADGFMGRKLPGLADASPLTVEAVHTWADAHRRFDADSVGFKVARGILTATRDDAELGPAAEQWVGDLAERAASGRFLFSVVDVAVVLRRPA